VKRSLFSIFNTRLGQSPNPYAALCTKACLVRGRIFAYAFEYLGVSQPSPNPYAALCTKACLVRGRIFAYAFEYLGVSRPSPNPYAALCTKACLVQGRIFAYAFLTCKLLSLHVKALSSAGFVKSAIGSLVLVVFAPFIFFGLVA